MVHSTGTDQSQTALMEENLARGANLNLTPSQRDNHIANADDVPKYVLESTRTPLHPKKLHSKATIDSVESAPLTPSVPQEGGVPQEWTVKEQEKIMDEIRKENFDMKLRVFHLEDRLRNISNAKVDILFQENSDLKVRNDALAAENRTYKELVEAAQAAVHHQQQIAAARSHEDSELQRLRQELELTGMQLNKTVALNQKYESQLALFDKESREIMQKTKQLEIDLGSANKKLSEAQQQITDQQGEISALEEDLNRKSNIIHQFKMDSSVNAQNFELATRKIEELNRIIETIKEERDTLARESATVKKERSVFDSGQKGSNRFTPGSPRSSIDIVESRMIKELGQTSRRFHDMEKVSESTVTERNQLINQNQQLTDQLARGINIIAQIIDKYCSTGAVTASPFAETPSIDQILFELESVSSAILSELNNARQICAAHESELAHLNKVIPVLQEEKQRYAEDLEQSLSNAKSIQHELREREADLEQAATMLNDMRAKVDSVYTSELPKYRQECEQLQSHLHQATKELQTLEKENEMLEKQLAEATAKYKQASELIVNNANNASEKSQQVTQLQQLRDDLLKKLSNREDANLKLTQKVAELQAQLEHAQKVKTAIEESFNADLKALHNANSELRMKLNSHSTDSSDLVFRLEKVQNALRMAEKENLQLQETLKSKEISHNMLIREHEVKMMEHRNLELELAQRQEQLRKAEIELSKLKREEHSSRRNMDGLEHLQSKVQNLTNVNTFLKEQCELKEKLVHELEEKLRRQAEEMKHAYGEVEASTRRLKKREMLINQVFKRLESINSADATTNTLAESLAYDHGSPTKKENKQFNSNVEF